MPVKKIADPVGAGAPLAERKNMLYAGTFVAAGEGKMLVTAVGADTEIGAIAGELSVKRTAKARSIKSSPA